MGLNRGFKGRQFTAAVILWAVRWYLMFPISYRDLQLMLLDRGVEVDHSPIFRWIHQSSVIVSGCNWLHRHVRSGKDRELDERVCTRIDPVNQG
jgi:transposase-like protein